MLADIAKAKSGFGFSGCPQRVFLLWDLSSGRSQIVSLKCEKLQLWGAKSNQLTVLVVLSGSWWSSLGNSDPRNLLRSCRIIVTLWELALVISADHSLLPVYLPQFRKAPVQPKPTLDCKIDVPWYHVILAVYAVCYAPELVVRDTS